MSHLIIVGDSRRLPIADGSVHCCVTSPPYWNLRDYGVDGQLGMEPTPEEYVANMVNVFSEVHRVLRDDGTLWLNLGDSYGGDRGSRSPAPDTKYRSLGTGSPFNLDRNYNRRKQLVGIPWKVAFALQDAGWVLRQDIVWNKPNAMSESVRDRCTKSHEYLFLLSKNLSYFYDYVAVKEPAVSQKPAGNKNHKYVAEYESAGDEKHRTKAGLLELSGVEWNDRNLRSVWTIPTQGFKGAHFAVFPQKLASRCILAGTSAKGCCPECGSPWTRIVERERIATRPGSDSKVVGLGSDVVGNRDPLRHVSVTKSVGWEPSCKCGRSDVEPCVVLDVFNGAGTTGLVAVGAGRRYIGVEINPEYAAMADRRISRPHEVVASGKVMAMPLFDGMLGEAS